jgi:hypothetical protein
MDLFCKGRWTVGAADPDLCPVTRVQAIRTSSNEAPEIEFGSLYPGPQTLGTKRLDRLEMGEFGAQSPGEVLPSDGVGPKTTVEEHAKWNQFVVAIASVMEGR